MGLKILLLQSNFVFNFAERSDGNISKDSWKRWSNTLLKTVGDNYGKEEAKLKAEKVGCFGSNLRPMCIPSIWPSQFAFIWVEQSDEHTSNAQDSCTGWFKNDSHLIREIWSTSKGRKFPSKYKSTIKHSISFISL